MAQRHYRHVDFSTPEGRLELHELIQADAANLGVTGMQMASFRIILRRPHVGLEHQVQNKETRTFQSDQSFFEFLMIETYEEKWAKIATRGYVVEIGVAKFRGKQFIGWNERYDIYTYEQK